MDTMRRSATLTTNELSLLAYAQHMAATARSKEAKTMFQMYAVMEKCRIKRDNAPGWLGTRQVKGGV